ncbi:MAG: glycosyltransferase family 2 protein [Acidobacteriota bacterium]
MLAGLLAALDAHGRAGGTSGLVVTSARLELLDYDKLFDMTPCKPFSVSVVIPTYKGKNLLARFLPSVVTALRTYTTATGAPVEILVVDDGSRDDTVEWLMTGMFDFVRVLSLPVNRGFAPTCNQGFAAARHALIWLLNNDIEVTPDALFPLVEHFSRPTVFAVASRALRLGSDAIDGAGRLGRCVRGYWKVFEGYDVLPDQMPCGVVLPTFVASGGYSLFDAAKLRALGGFDELLAPFYWEDVELCYRAWKRGWEVCYEPRSLVFHQSSATIRSRFEARTVEITATRNRLLMHWIHLHDTRWWLAHLAMTGLLLLSDVVTRRGYREAFRQAWACRRAAFRRRRQERSYGRRTDREVAAIFAAVRQRPYIKTFRNQVEEIPLRAAWARASGFCAGATDGETTTGGAF